MNGTTSVLAATNYQTYTVSDEAVCYEKTVYISISATEEEATANTTYTMGSGRISTEVAAYAYHKSVPIDSNDRTYSDFTAGVSTPNSDSITVTVPSTHAVDYVCSNHIYSLYINSDFTASGNKELYLDLP